MVTSDKVYGEVVYHLRATERWMKSVGLLTKVVLASVGMLIFWPLLSMVMRVYWGLMMKLLFQDSIFCVVTSLIVVATYMDELETQMGTLVTGIILLTMLAASIFGGLVLIIVRGLVHKLFFESFLTKGWAIDSSVAIITIAFLYRAVRDRSVPTQMPTNFVDFYENYVAKAPIYALGMAVVGPFMMHGSIVAHAVYVCFVYVVVFYLPLMIENAIPLSTVVMVDRFVTKNLNIPGYRQSRKGSWLFYSQEPKSKYIDDCHWKGRMEVKVLPWVWQSRFFVLLEDVFYVFKHPADPAPYEMFDLKDFVVQAESAIPDDSPESVKRLRKHHVVHLYPVARSYEMTYAVVRKDARFRASCYEAMKEIIFMLNEGRSQEQNRRKTELEIEKRQTKAATAIQSSYRGYKVRRKYIEEKDAVMVIERGFGTRLERRRYLKKRVCALKIQNAFRGYVARRDYEMTILSICLIQNHVRNWLLRRRRTKEEEMKSYAAAVMIQKHVRGYFARCELNKMLHQKRKRLFIVNEILSTEVSYVDALNLLIDFYMKPLGSRLTVEQVETIFGNIEDICVFHEKLCTNIKERVNHWESEELIGGVFVEMHLEYLSLYTEYINNFDSSQTMLAFVKTKPKVFSFLADIYKDNPARSGENGSREVLNLESYLIMPVQRIPRYVLLLQDLLKRTPRDAKDYKKLTSALQKMRALAAHINMSKDYGHQVSKVALVQENMTGKFENLITPTRRFIKEGMLKKKPSSGQRGKHKRRQFFLFNDCLVYAARWKLKHRLKEFSQQKRFVYKGRIPLLNASVRDVEDTEELQNAFSIISSSGTFVIYAANKNQKAIWMNEIRKAITELHAQLLKEADLDGSPESFDSSSIQSSADIKEVVATFERDEVDAAALSGESGESDEDDMEGYSGFPGADSKDEISKEEVEEIDDGWGVTGFEKEILEKKKANPRLQDDDGPSTVDDLFDWLQRETTSIKQVQMTSLSDEEFVSDEEISDVALSDEERGAVSTSVVDEEEMKKRATLKGPPPIPPELKKARRASLRIPMRPPPPPPSHRDLFASKAPRVQESVPKDEPQIKADEEAKKEEKKEEAEPATESVIPPTEAASATADTSAMGKRKGTLLKFGKSFRKMKGKKDGLSALAGSFHSKEDNASTGEPAQEIASSTTSNDKPSSDDVHAEQDPTKSSPEKPPKKESAPPSLPPRIPESRGPKPDVVKEEIEDHGDGLDKRRPMARDIENPVLNAPRIPSKPIELQKLGSKKPPAVPPKPEKPIAPPVVPPKPIEPALLGAEDHDGGDAPSVQVRKPEVDIKNALSNMLSSDGFKGGFGSARVGLVREGGVESISREEEKEEEVPVEEEEKEEEIPVEEEEKEEEIPVEEEEAEAEDDVLMDENINNEGVEPEEEPEFDVEGEEEEEDSVEEPDQVEGAKDVIEE